ncbi:pantoate--beta-alanine ligase [Paracoccus sphaerophysae]|uniref:Pantothenate synthetase n=1 Tax=Paracoccus sphaerophysae TaxID=690417 RepID=A0A099F4S2_9RHOB|nr:pantoate--beta-alanine ligase [Paracoccus sphaerophysae]KGJ05278.1 pantoate--beta-alanine ligase [Paracoccus sphaerophysae]
MTAHSSPIQVVRSVVELRAVTRGWRQAGDSVAVVPTMGALHDGHLSLVAQARDACDRVIVTLFVNLTQFDRPEDLAKYPRTENRDRAVLEPAGVDLLFMPGVDEVYPPGFATTVSVSGLTSGMCGDFRPGHFDGMATIVAKLFLMTGADRAFFGEKDWQQLQIVRRLAADLNIPIEVIGCPTVREADGLAMSSRNARLSPPDRTAAPALYAALTHAAQRLRGGEDPAPVLEAARAEILAGGFARVEYLDLRHPQTLTPLDRLDGPARLLAAAWLGPVRLIDNVAV